MSVSSTSSVSLETSTAVTSEGTTSESESYTLDLAFSLDTGGAEGDDGMTLVAGGDAVALGENTLATGSVTAVVSDGGSANEAYATASFDAVAVSGEDGGAFASAISFAEVSGGADYSFSMSYTTTETSVQDGTTVTSQSSGSTVYALDVDLSGTDGATAADAGPETEPTAPPAGTSDALVLPADCGCGDSDPYAALDGNVAYFDVEAAAYGDDTSLQVDAFALAIEDELSNTTVVVVAAVE